MDTFKYNNFIFSSKYRVWRHVAFWLADVIFIVLLYSSTLGLWRSVIHNFIWLPTRFFVHLSINPVVHSQILVEKQVHYFFSSGYSLGNRRMVLEYLFQAISFRSNTSIFKICSCCSSCRSGKWTTRKLFSARDHCHGRQHDCCI